MAFTCGFFNSDRGDRKYNAEQISAIFDGIIADGVFATIGDHMAVTPGTGMQVLVGTGKAWFDHTWNVNDSLYSLEIAKSDVSLDRIDAVVLETNHSDSVRFNGFKVVQGSPSADPIRPSLTRNELINQHPLAWVRVKAGATAITASMIENAVGKTECPFVTGVVEVTSIDDLFNQWEGEFDEWFANLKTQLSGDVAANLQRQIDECKASKETKALYGLPPTATNDDLFKKLSISPLEETAEMYSLAIPSLFQSPNLNWISITDGIECVYEDHGPKVCVSNYGKKLYVPRKKYVISNQVGQYTSFYLTPEYDYCFLYIPNSSGPETLKLVKFKTNTDIIVSTLFTVYTDGKFDSYGPSLRSMPVKGTVYLYIAYQVSSTTYYTVLSFNPLTEEIRIIELKTTERRVLATNMCSIGDIVTQQYVTWQPSTHTIELFYRLNPYSDTESKKVTITTPSPTASIGTRYWPMLHSKNLAYILPMTHGDPIFPELGSYRSTDGLNWTRDTRFDSFLANLGSNARIMASFFKEDTLYLILKGGIGYEVPAYGDISGPIDLSYIDPRSYCYTSRYEIPCCTKYLVGGYQTDVKYGRYNVPSAIYPEKIKVNSKRGYQDVAFDNTLRCYNIGFKVKSIGTIFGTYTKNEHSADVMGTSNDAGTFSAVFGTDTVAIYRQNTSSGSFTDVSVPCLAFGGD